MNVLEAIEITRNQAEMFIRPINGVFPPGVGVRYSRSLGWRLIQKRGGKVRWSRPLPAAFDMHDIECEWEALTGEELENEI